MWWMWKSFQSRWKNLSPEVMKSFQLKFVYVFEGQKKLEWNGMQWHEECFKCTHCNVEIGCNSFMPKDNQQYCIQCFNDLFAPKCKACGQVSYIPDNWLVSKRSFSSWSQKRKLCFCSVFSARNSFGSTMAAVNFFCFFRTRKLFRSTFLAVNFFPMTASCKISNFSKYGRKILMNYDEQ